METIISNCNIWKKNILLNGIEFTFADCENCCFVISPSRSDLEFIVSTLCYVFFKQIHCDKYLYVPIFSFDTSDPIFRNFAKIVLECIMIDFQEFIFLNSFSKNYVDKFDITQDTIKFYHVRFGETHVKEIIDPHLEFPLQNSKFLLHLSTIIISEPTLQESLVCKMLTLSLSHILHNNPHIAMLEAHDVLSQVSSIISEFDFKAILNQAYEFSDFCNDDKSGKLDSYKIEHFNFYGINLFYGRIFYSSSDKLSNVQQSVTSILNLLEVESLDAYLGAATSNICSEIPQQIIFVAKLRLDLDTAHIWSLFMELLCECTGLEEFEFDHSDLDTPDHVIIQVFDQVNKSFMLSELNQLVSKSVHNFDVLMLSESSDLNKLFSTRNLVHSGTLTDERSVNISKFEMLNSSNHINTLQPEPRYLDTSLPTQCISSEYSRNSNLTSYGKIPKNFQYFQLLLKSKEILTKISSLDNIFNRNLILNGTLECKKCFEVQNSTQVDWKKLRRRYKKVCINEQEYVLDMELIERFTRIFQHGGYLQDRTRLPVVLIVGKYLPLKTEKLYPEILKELFLYVISHLDSLIFDHYILIYIHSGVQQHQLPSYPWIKQFYEIINERMKKSLTALYIVNPSSWIRTTLKLSKPLISRKFWQKLHFVDTTATLYNLLKLEPNVIPNDIVKLDNKTAKSRAKK